MTSFPCFPTNKALASLFFKTYSSPSSCFFFFTFRLPLLISSSPLSLPLATTVLCIYEFIFFKIPHIRGIIWYLSNFFEIDLPDIIMPFRSIYVATNGKISFLWLNILISVCVYMYICTPRVLYPFIHQGTVRLFPYVGYCK